MRHYTVFFDVYGKKMKVSVLADSEAGAIHQVKTDIKIHKVERKRQSTTTKEPSWDDFAKQFEQFFGK